MVKLIRAFRNFANASKIGHHQQGHSQRLGGGCKWYGPFGAPKWALMMIKNVKIKDFFTHQFLNYWPK